MRLRASSFCTLDLLPCTKKDSVAYGSLHLSLLCSVTPWASLRAFNISTTINAARRCIATAAFATILYLLQQGALHMRTCHEPQC